MLSTPLMLSSVLCAEKARHGPQGCLAGREARGRCVLGSRGLRGMRRADRPGGGLRGGPPSGVASTHSTELAYFDGRRKVQMTPIVDHASRLALWWPMGERTMTGLALEAWERVR